jgi:quinol monooxygenase YgiN
MWVKTSDGEAEMAIRVIVELQAKPGKRAELKSLLDSMVAIQGSSQPGFLGSTRYEVVDNPDMLVEIADWESAEARMAHMQEAADNGAYASVVELLAVPYRATVIKQFP